MTYPNPQGHQWILFLKNTLNKLMYPVRIKTIIRNPRFNYEFQE